MTYGLLATLVFVSLTMPYARIVRRGRPRIPHILVLWLILAGVLALSVAAAAPSHSVATATTNVATYLFMSEVYIFVYALSFGSVSIQILVTMLELEAAPDSFQRTLAKHSAEDFLKVRLDSLLAQGLLLEEDGRYRITDRGRRWARTGMLLKKALAVGVGG